MPSRAPSRSTRWHRLFPRDLADAGWIALGCLGLFLTALHALGLEGAGFGSLGVVVAPLLALHGSTPVSSFLALAVYLMRWGRTIGAARRWVWAGFAATLPLWFLAGQALSVRGLGDGTLVVVSWNLLALGLMGYGVWRTLRTRDPG